MPNQRLEEIRRKYDTPTRKELKEIQVRHPIDKPTHPVLDIELRKSVNSTATAADASMHERWNYKQSVIGKDGEMSPIAYRKENEKNEE